MVLRLEARQGNLRIVFRLCSLLRGFTEHEMNNLNMSLRFPCCGLNTIVDYFSHTSFSSFSEQENEVAISSVFPRNIK